MADHTSEGANPLNPLDSLNMVGIAAGLADQIEVAAATASEVEGLPSVDGVTSVVVLGMGGSGIGGDLAAAVSSPELPVPMSVVKGYSAPGFIGPNTLVFASSFSGNTEETLEAATEAHERGGRLVVLSNGGELGRLAGAWGVPWIRIQDGIPMPRAGIGAVSIPLLVVLDRLGLWSGSASQISDAVGQLRRRTEQLSKADSPASVLARRIGRTLPIVYGGGPLGEVAAIRWKGQFNENAKVASFANRIPELTHNEICGWGLNGDVTRQVFSMVLLRHAYEHPQVARRFALVEEICTEIVDDVYSVEAEGGTPLGQLFDLILFGDFVTLELALQTGVDPGPVAILDEIKARLKT